MFVTTRFRLGVVVAAVLALAVLAPARGRAGDRDELVDYVVQDGDTCASIARRMLGDKMAEVTIHLYNPQLGPEPHVLKTGAVLRLPSRDLVLAADATLLHKQGPVEVRAPGQAAAPARRDGDLLRGARLDAPVGASAHVRFADDVGVVLRGDSRATFSGRDDERPKATADEVVLDRGVVSVAVAARGAAKPPATALTVKTAAALAEVVAGHAVIAVDADGTTRISNLDGEALKVRAVGAGGKKKPVTVAAGMGVTIAPGEAPSAPRALPPPPLWQRDSELFLAEGGAGTIRQRLAAAPGAVDYRIDIARDAEGLDVIARVVASTEAIGLEAHNLPPGTYWLHAATVDDAGLESTRSAAVEVRVVPIGFVAPGDPAPAAGGVAAPALDEAAVIDPVRSAVPAVARGSRVLAPAGMRCAADGGSATAELLLTDLGERMVVCSDDTGAASEPFSVRVADVTAQALQGPSLPRDAATELEIAVVSEARVGPDLRVASPGITVASLASEPGLLRVALTPGKDALSLATLSVLTAEGVLLGTATVTIQPEGFVDGAARWRLALPGGGWRITAGGFGGYAHFSEEFELGNAADAAYVPDSGAMGGVRFALWPHPILGVELEGVFAPTGFAGAAGSAGVVGARLHGVARLGRGRAAAFLLAGFGAQVLTGDRAHVGRDSDTEVHWGAGVEVELTRDLALRVDGRQLLAPARDEGSVVNIEAAVGLSWAFSLPRW